MTLKSNTFTAQPGGNAKADAKKKLLLKRHSGAIGKVIADAKTFSEDRKRALDRISDTKLRESAAR